VQTSQNASPRVTGQHFGQHDPVAEFTAEAHSIGLVLDRAVDDDQIHRVPVVGKGRHNTSGSYKLKVESDGFAFGWAKNWVTGQGCDWCSRSPSAEHDAEWAARHAQARAEAERQREQDKAEVLAESMREFNAAKPCQSHPYFTDKGVPVPVDARINDKDSALIPVYHNGKPVGFERILARKPDDGPRKRHCKGGLGDGFHWTDGDESTIYITEGIAKSMAVHEVTGAKVYTAFGQLRLVACAKLARSIHPDAQIIVAGDMDDDPTCGPQKAQEAATAVGGVCVLPPNPDEDWDDILRLRGSEALVDALRVDQLTICAASLAGLPVPLRQWIVEGIVPRRVVTLLYGDGGLGKSLLAMQLGVSVATGTNWIGHPTDTGPALYLGAEDEQDEMHIRLTDICASHGVELADLKQLHIRSLVGEDALLATSKNQYTQLEPSELYFRLVREVRRVRPKLVILDTLADLYPSDENYKAHVRQFMGFLKKIAHEHDCAVVVLAHPSKSGMAEGRGDSGNVAWNGSARARLYLTRPNDDEASPDERILEVKKLNAGKVGDAFKLQWVAGAFKLRQGENMLDKVAMDAKAVRVFLKLLRASNETGVPVSESRAAATFSKDPDREGITKRKFDEVKTRLLREGTIKIEEGKRGSRYLVVAA